MYLHQTCRRKITAATAASTRDEHDPRTPTTSNDCSSSNNKHGTQPEAHHPSITPTETNLDEAVDIVLGVVQVKTGPQASGGPQLTMQRLRAVVPGPNRHTFLEASKAKRGRQAGSHHDWHHTWNTLHRRLIILAHSRTRVVAAPS